MINRGGFSITLQFLAQFNQVFPQLVFGLWMIQAILDVRGQPAKLVPGVVAVPLVFVGKNPLRLIQGVDRIG